MENPLRFIPIICIILLFSHDSHANSSVCPRSCTFINAMKLQCPAWIEKIAPEEVGGIELDRELQHAQENVYYSVFFYASWCPFSRKTQPIFDALSSMFPQVNHLAIEESSAMPSVFSRYGIHSFPSILIASRTRRIHYHGPKDLDSLVKFYKETTGFDPVAYFSVEETLTMPSKTSQSPKEIVTSNPYLALAILYICLKAFIYIFPTIISRIKAFLFTHPLHVNVEIFGEWNHNLLDRVRHVIDLKNNCLSIKARNFRKRATNARVWASSLASVSLGESSSRNNEL